MGLAVRAPGAVGVVLGQQAVDSVSDERAAGLREVVEEEGRAARVEAVALRRGGGLGPCGARARELQGRGDGAVPGVEGPQLRGGGRDKG